MPVVARVLDLHSCPSHLGGPVLPPGHSKVIVCFLPVARKGDKVFCLGAVDTIIEGDETVIIEGRPIARKGDRTEHGGVILTGCPCVWIGRARKGLCKIRAAQKRAPFIKYQTPKRAKFLAEP